jgi:hypothetical protein
MSAVISDCGRYRYRLERHGLSGFGAVAWIMVNPSTADAETDDATIRKVVGFSERLGFDRAIVGNLFAYRATDIGQLKRVQNTAIGPDNDYHLGHVLAQVETVIVAWGALSKLPPGLRHRWRGFVRLASDYRFVTLKCLGTAQDGHPRHPLMLSYNTPLRPWVAPQ